MAATIVVGCYHHQGTHFKGKGEGGPTDFAARGPKYKGGKGVQQILPLAVAGGYKFYPWETCVIFAEFTKMTPFF